MIQCLRYFLGSVNGIQLIKNLVTGRLIENYSEYGIQYLDEMLERNKVPGEIRFVLRWSLNSNCCPMSYCLAIWSYFQRTSPNLSCAKISRYRKY